MSNEHYIAVEIGGTKLQAVLGTAEGEILQRERTRVDLEGGVPWILAWCREAIVRLDNGTARGIGVGFGGPVESATGRVLTSHQVSGWDGVRLVEALAVLGDCPVRVYNDSSAAGWGEYRLGAGRGTTQFCYINIGSGIGGALVLDGKLYDGQGLGAAENGHTYISDWTAESAGAVDKLEHLCSGWAIERRIRGWEAIDLESPLGELCGGDADALTCAMLGEAAATGDARAREELERVAGGIGQALCNVLALVHPELIAVGGGVALIGEPLLAPLRAYVAEHVFGPYAGRYRIEACKLGEDVVLAGALLLAGEGR